MTRKRSMIKWVLTHFFDFLGELHFARSLSSKIKNCSSSVERLNSFFLETELIAFFCSISFFWNGDEKLILRCLFGVGGSSKKFLEILKSFLFGVLANILLEFVFSFSFSSRSIDSIKLSSMSWYEISFLFLLFLISS